MVDLEGSCTAQPANSGTLLTVEIYLSPTTPQQVIQEIKARVVDSPTNAETPLDQPGVVDGIYRPMPAASSHSSANVHPHFQLDPSIVLKTVPSIELKAGKSSLGFGVRTFLIAAGCIYQVTCAAVYTVPLIGQLQPLT